MIWHWLFEQWVLMYPNIFAFSIWTIAAIIVTHVRATAKREELERHVKLQRHYNKNDPYTLDTPDSAHPGD